MNVYGIETDKIEVINAPQDAKSFFMDLYSTWSEKGKNYKYKCQIMLVKFLIELPDKELSIIDYIHRKLADPKLSVALLAQRNYVSEAYFRRDFKKKYGISPLQYINKERIDRTKNLLSTNYYTVHELEEQQEALEREMLIEKSKTAIKVPESIIREYYEEALRLEATMIVNLLVKEIVLYNDRIEIYINSPIKNGSDESQGFSFYQGFIGNQSIQTMEFAMYVS